MPLLVANATVADVLAEIQKWVESTHWPERLGSLVADHLIIFSNILAVLDVVLIFRCTAYLASKLQDLQLA